MPRAYLSSRGGAGVSFGCLALPFVGFIYTSAMILYVTLVIVVVLAVILFLALAYLGAWVAIGIDALLRRFISGYREKRVDRGQLDWPQRVNTMFSQVPARATKNPLRREVAQP